MKTLALAFLLLPNLALAAPANKADYPVTIHVEASRAVPLGFNLGTWQVTYQQVDAVIGGKKVQLSANSLGVLALGDYPAKDSEKVHGPHNPNTYDIYQGYDMLMPDGKVRTFQVTGIGADGPPPPAATHP